MAMEYVLPGALAGLIGTQTKEVLDRLVGTDEDGYSIKDCLLRIEGLLTRLLEVSSETDQPDEYETIGLYQAGYEYYVPTYRRNHLSLLMPSANVLTYRIPGMQPIVRTVSTSGWIQLDMPSRTELWVNTPVNALIRWGNTALGSSL